MLLNIKLLKKSFRQAILGLKKVLATQQNFRIQVVAALIVVALALVLKINLNELALLIIIIALVLILELINTAFERIVDILKPRIHIYAENIKDILAGAVFLASALAIIVGLLIFLPYLF